MQKLDLYVPTSVVFVVVVVAVVVVDGFVKNLVPHIQSWLADVLMLCCRIMTALCRTFILTVKERGSNCLVNVAMN